MSVTSPISSRLITNDSSLAEELYFIQKSGGAIPSPFDCWLLLRSTKTMALRVQKQSDNAMKLSKILQENSEVEYVIYPGLESHAQHKLAIRQQASPDDVPIFGSMVSFKCNSIEKRDRFLSKLKLFTLAESLGGVESLVCIPYEMTHASVPEKIKKNMDLTQELVRLSVGIEHLDDLSNDIIQALED